MIKLAIFDMDGTVFESRLDWLKIRDELNIKPGENILREIYKGNRVDEARLALLEKYEKENTMVAAPLDGVLEFLNYLKDRGLIITLATNNNRENTDFLLNKYTFHFDQVITREMNLWKPEPDAFFYLMRFYRCQPSETISFGDTYYDINASKAAGLSGIHIVDNHRFTSSKEPGVIYFKNYRSLKRQLDVDTST
ncbi:MAG: HAD-IA family hydrolase [bacterium]|nr:HAD-IA family hydrolase [bacterium]